MLQTCNPYTLELRHWFTSFKLENSVFINRMFGAMSGFIVF